MDLQELAKLAETDRKACEERLKNSRDFKDVLDTSYRKGIEQGRLKIRKKIAIGCFKEGVDIEVISKVTGMSREELRTLFQK